jgi:hypothetical protein
MIGMPGKGAKDSPVSPSAAANLTQANPVVKAESYNFFVME